MRERFLLALMVGFSPVGFAEELNFASTDWPCWRGAKRDGIASGDSPPPTEWSETKNVIWKQPVPGRGHGSVTVVGNPVLLAAAEHDSQTQSVLCFDRDTGRSLWKAKIHQGRFVKRMNKKATLASSTMASDGERFFISFLNGGAVYTSAISREGEILWQTKITEYKVHQGYGSSPAVYRSLVIVSADNKKAGCIAGLERKTGKIVWKTQRARKPNYASPVIHHIHGRDQLLFSGTNLVSSFDPMTGETIWEIKGATTECVTTMPTNGDLVFTSGGYPRNHVSAIRADGSGTVVWENSVRVYVPSMIVHKGYLYAVTDAGIAVCWKSDTGKEMWKGRLGGTFSSSLVLAGDLFYAANESGKTFIFEATPGKFTLRAENTLGNEVFATPTFSGGRIYQRVAHMIGNQRREMLYCIGLK